MQRGRCHWSRALCCALWQVSGRACSCKKDPCYTGHPCYGQLTTVKIWYPLISVTCITGSGVQRVTLAMSPNHIQSVFNLTLDIHVMVNWQLSKYGIRWSVLHVSRARVYNLLNWSVLKLSACRWYCFSVDPRLRSIFSGRIPFAYFLNIGTLNVHELFWMLQCNFNASV